MDTGTVMMELLVMKSNVVISNNVKKYQKLFDILLLLFGLADRFLSTMHSLC